MSKFINAIQAELTGKQFHRGVAPKLLTVRTERTEPFRNNRAQEYVISIKYGARYVCGDGDLERATQNVIRSLRSCVYDDFMHLILELEQELLGQGDSVKMLDLIQKIYAEVGR